MLVIKRQFGPKLTAKQQRNTIGLHGGCWVNDADCGDSECVAAQHSGAPMQISITGKAFAGTAMYFDRVRS